MADHGADDDCIPSHFIIAKYIYLSKYVSRYNDCNINLFIFVQILLKSVDFLHRFYI